MVGVAAFGPAAPAAELPEAAAAVELDPSWHAVGRREADIDLGRRLRREAAAAGGERRPWGDDVAPDDAASGRTLRRNRPRRRDRAARGDGHTHRRGRFDALFADDSIYTAGAAGVVPPVMLLPRMPKSAFYPEARPQSPVVEVLVNQQGGVDAVRLRGREQPGVTLYRARMMLSAAKAWQFTPARLDGRPVRYVMRVVLEP